MPVWIGDLGTRTKNPKWEWFRPKNRHFDFLVLQATALKIFNTIGYNAKDF
jgi:hypothetical protein